MNNGSEKYVVSPFRAGLLCKCPKCGVGGLYSGFLTFGDKCAHCGLDHTCFDAGDGAVAFITTFVGFVIVALALAVEVKFGPPIWLHLLLWIPCIIGGSLLLMRPVKALMVAAEYHFNASEGKHDQ